MEQSGTTETSDYLLHIERIRGRMNFAVLSRERLVIVKFDGWPEVHLSRVPKPRGSHVLSFVPGAI